MKRKLLNELALVLPEMSEDKRIRLKGGYLDNDQDPGTYLHDPDWLSFTTYLADVVVTPNGNYTPSDGYDYFYWLQKDNNRDGNVNSDDDSGGTGWSPGTYDESGVTLDQVNAAKDFVKQTMLDGLGGASSYLSASITVTEKVTMGKWVQTALDLQGDDALKLTNMGKLFSRVSLVTGGLGVVLNISDGGFTTGDVISTVGVVVGGIGLVINVPILIGAGVVLSIGALVWDVIDGQEYGTTIEGAREWLSDQWDALGLGAAPFSFNDFNFQFIEPNPNDGDVDYNDIQY
jgi:hypothetical protein